MGWCREQSGNHTSLAWWFRNGSSACRRPLLPSCLLRQLGTLENSHSPSVRKLTRFLQLFPIVFLFFWAGLTAQVKEGRRVLVLHESGLGSPGMELADREIVSALERSPYRVELYSETLETGLFSDKTSQQEFRDWFVRKYRDRKPDVIIAVGPSPIRFMNDSHDRFFPGTPIVFCESTEELAGNPHLDSHFTGVWALAQPEKTLHAALRLQPGTKHVVVVGGVAPYDRYLETLVKEHFRSYEASLDFTYLTDFSMPELLERLKHLPIHTIVYHTSITQDAAGNHFIDATQSAPLVASAADAPVFVADDVDVSKGTIGGDLMSWADDSRAAAEMAARLLSGEKPQDIPIIKKQSIYLFDWRALRRWGLKESALPPGSIVLNRPPSFWQTYKRYVLAGSFLILAQSVAIFALLWQRAMRKTIEGKLLRAVEQLRLAMESGESIGWEWDVGSEHSYWFGDLRTMFGIPSDTYTATIGDFHRYVHPEDRERVLRAVAAAKKKRTPYTAEFRIVRRDGTTRWIVTRGEFAYSGNGNARRMRGMAVDITERKQMEEALKKSEEKFSVAFRESPVAFTLTSANEHRYIEVNETFERITGWKREEIIGRTPLDIEIWADPNQRISFVRQLLCAGSVRDFEVGLRTKDGQARTGVGSAELIEVNGEQCALSAIADVTEVKRAEAARHASEHRFSQFFETLPEYCYITSPAGEILDVNPAACQALNYTKEELIGKPLSDIYASDSALKLVNLLEKWKKSGTLDNEEMVILTKEGKRRTVLLNAGAVKDTNGNLLHSASVQVDITALKAIQEKLRESQSRLKGIIESAMDAIIAVDDDQRIIVFNAAAEKMFACRVRDAIGSSIDRFIPECSQDIGRAYIWPSGKLGLPPKGMGTLGALKGLRTTGEEFPIEASISRSETAGKKVFTVIIRDITERLRAEEALSSVSRRLIEAQEEERTRIARELHDDINQRMALLAAHLERLKQDLPASEVQTSRRIEEACAEISDLGSDIQSLSHRLHSSKLEYLGLEAAASSFCRELSEQKVVEIAFHSRDVPKKLPQEVALCLFRVLQEALQNAVKHSGAQRYEVWLIGAMNEIRLTVQDAGIGFDVEEALKGRGLGITSMKERLKLVAGRLSIDSQPNAGTTVQATVPLAADARSAKAGGC